MCQKNDNGEDDAPCHSIDPAMYLYSQHSQAAVAKSTVYVHARYEKHYLAN